MAKGEDRTDDPRDDEQASSPDADEPERSRRPDPFTDEKPAARRPASRESGDPPEPRKPPPARAERTRPSDLGAGDDPEDAEERAHPQDKPPAKRGWFRRKPKPGPRDEASADDEPRPRSRRKESARDDAPVRSPGRPSSHGEDGPSDRARRRRVASLDDFADLSDDELADLPDTPSTPFRRPPWWALLGAALLLFVVVLVFLGEYNAERYHLVCHGSSAEARRGRGFPWPFGHRALTGPQYRSVPLGPETQCETQELGSEDELQRSLLTLVLAEIERRRHADKLEDLQRARRLLTQGMTLARTDKKRRHRLQALQGVLDLREGQLRLAELAPGLLQIRRLFLRARQRAPKGKVPPAIGVAVELVDHLLERLKEGRAPRVPGPPTPVVLPPGPSRPVIPSRPGPSPDGGVPPVRTPPRPDPDARPTPAVPAPPDAGVSGGGILL